MLSMEVLGGAGSRPLSPAWLGGGQVLPCLGLCLGLQAKSSSSAAAPASPKTASVVIGILNCMKTSFLSSQEAEACLTCQVLHEMSRKKIWLGGDLPWEGRRRGDRICGGLLLHFVFVLVYCFETIPITVYKILKSVCLLAR